MPNDASAPPLQPPFHEGSITIQYRYREEDREFVWDYRPDPPIPDELAVRLNRSPRPNYDITGGGEARGAE